MIFHGMRYVSVSPVVRLSLGVIRGGYKGLASRSYASRSDTVGRVRAAITQRHVLWFHAVSHHAGFGLDGWTGLQIGTGYTWTQPELWQDMEGALKRAQGNLLLLRDRLAVPGTSQGLLGASRR